MLQQWLSSRVVVSRRVSEHRVAVAQRGLVLFRGVSGGVHQHSHDSIRRTARHKRRPCPELRTVCDLVRSPGHGASRRGSWGWWTGNDVNVALQHAPFLGWTPLQVSDRWTSPPGRFLIFNCFISFISFIIIIFWFCGDTGILGPTSPNRRTSSGRPRSLKTSSYQFESLSFLHSLSLPLTYCLMLWLLILACVYCHACCLCHSRVELWVLKYGKTELTVSLTLSCQVNVLLERRNP